MRLITMAAAAGMVVWPAAQVVPPVMGTGAMGAGVMEAAVVQDDFTWHGRMRAGQTLEIKGINGAIRATVASGDEAEVVATKSARRSDPDEVEIKVLEHAGGVTICAVYPSRRNREPNECGVGDRGRMNNENNDVSVEFTVKVPAGVRFAPRTVNGGVRATGLRSDVDATTVNGDIRVATTGRAEATTVNGSIDAAMGRADWDGKATFHTVNGGITVTLPADVGAEVHASTVNGDINTEFGLQVRGRFGPRSVNGRIGPGGPELDLETVNGSIELRKAD